MDKKRLLVVVDMQKDFINGSLGTSEAKNIVEKVVDKIQQYQAEGDYIVYTMDTHNEEYMETQEGKNLPVSHCIYPQAGWQLDDQIGEAIKGADGIAGRDVEYKKGTFGSWDLGEAVKSWEQHIESIELVGVCTGICVISNAVIIKAAVPEIPLMVDASCCACVTPDTHNTALEAMKLLQIKVKGEDL